MKSEASRVRCDERSSLSENEIEHWLVPSLRRVIMMSARKMVNKGFTLVEILIVVVILGILAAIVIPQFTAASETAQTSSAVSTLQAVRSQLELYRVNHNGNYPSKLWDQLTKTTDRTGDVTKDGFGPYLPKPPVNPFTGGTAVGKDWVYDSTTGTVKMHLPASIDNKEITQFELDMTHDFTRDGGAGTKS